MKAKVVLRIVPVLKRAGMPINYVPWLELVASTEDNMEMVLVDRDAEEKWQEWLAEHLDEPEDIAFVEEESPRAGIRMTGRAIPVQRQPVTGVTDIRSFLR